MNDFPNYVEAKLKIFYRSEIDKHCFVDKISSIKKNSDILIKIEKLNDVRRLNKFHENINFKLKMNGFYICCYDILEKRRKRTRSKTPKGFKNLVRIVDFIFLRVLPKLPILKRIYFSVTKGQGRVLSKAEALGRLVSCGFEVLEYFEYKELLYVISKKKSEPDYNMKASYGPLFKMNRIGYKGKTIGVYKFRTMYPYSEYCQSLIINENKLAKTGKVFNDFRITTWGKFLRRFWIDELPMFINFFKGELSLVGVRPLSKNYFSKYPKHLQELRVKIKPGLIPPYYADLPQNFDEILLSEENYIKEKLKKPIFTDFRYFFKAFINIVFKGVRSS